MFKQDEFQCYSSVHLAAAFGVDKSVNHQPPSSKVVSTPTTELKHPIDSKRALFYIIMLKNVKYGNVSCRQLNDKRHICSKQF